MGGVVHRVTIHGDEGQGGVAGRALGVVAPRLFTDGVDLGGESLGVDPQWQPDEVPDEVVVQLQNGLLSLDGRDRGWRRRTDRDAW